MKKLQELYQWILRWMGDHGTHIPKEYRVELRHTLLLVSPLWIAKSTCPKFHKMMMTSTCLTSGWHTLSKCRAKIHHCTSYTRVRQYKYRIKHVYHAQHTVLASEIDLWIWHNSSFQQESSFNSSHLCRSSQLLNFSLLLNLLYIYSLFLPHASEDQHVIQTKAKGWTQKATDMSDLSVNSDTNKPFTLSQCFFLVFKLQIEGFNNLIFCCGVRNMCWRVYKKRLLQILPSTWQNYMKSKCQCTYTHIYIFRCGVVWTWVWSKSPPC